MQEYQSEKTEVTPIGSANDTFVLQRRYSDTKPILFTHLFLIMIFASFQKST